MWDLWTKVQSAGSGETHQGDIYISYHKLQLIVTQCCKSQTLQLHNFGVLSKWRDELFGRTYPEDRNEYWYYHQQQKAWQLFFLCQELRSSVFVLNGPLCNSCTGMSADWFHFFHLKLWRQEPEYSLDVRSVCLHSCMHQVLAFLIFSGLWESEE